MKKALLLIAAAGLMLSSCGEINDSSSQGSKADPGTLLPGSLISEPDSSSLPDDDSSREIPPDTEPETMKYFSKDQEELAITEDEAYGGTVYNGNQFYIAGGSGYFSAFDDGVNFIFTSEDALEDFCELTNISIDPSDFFNKLEGSQEAGEKLTVPSINGYQVVVSYCGYSFDGSSPKAGGILIKDNMLRFVYTAESLSKGELEASECVPDVMDGYFSIAAVPVSEMKSFSYPGWVYIGDNGARPQPEPEPTPDPDPDPTPAPKVNPDSDQPEIIMMYRYQNWAEGYQDSGAFVDADGRAYEFDFANGESYDFEPLQGDDLIAAFREIQKKSEPGLVVDKKIIDEIIELIPQVNKNAPMTKESVACDAGQHTIYIFRDGEQIELASYGDYERELQDDAAKKIVKLTEQ